MSHQINMSDFVDLAFNDSDIPYTHKHVIASSFGRGGRKSLKVVSDIKNMKVSLEVSDGLTKTTTYTLKDAITLYNSLP